MRDFGLIFIPNSYPRDDIYPITIVNQNTNCLLIECSLNQNRKQTLNIKLKIYMKWI